MATSREERMQQRMRGAGRHEVADDSFGFVLPAAEPSPDPSPSLPQRHEIFDTAQQRAQAYPDQRSTARCRAKNRLPSASIST
ncbi:hypothetical protein ONZ43_g6478 [Nemania bipapillata]|uniref:Uncharacterized protein n=1 Tax=Nemania bipapillata TaxID=110536 RepID=A0ACC2HZ41_9PEZI|nr:hypothetical protein ONZ43_g6478 [Nemania bipapillata]